MRMFTHAQCSCGLETVAEKNKIKLKRQPVASFSLSEDFKFKYSQQSTNTAHWLSSANMHSDLLPPVITAQCN